MPSRDVNAVTRLAEASWWRDKDSKYDVNSAALKLVGGVINKESCTCICVNLPENVT